MSVRDRAQTKNAFKYQDPPGISLKSPRARLVGMGGFVMGRQDKS